MNATGIVLAPCLALLLNPNPHATPAYTQSYVILLRGMPSGTEVTTEESDKDGDFVSSSESEIFITDGVDIKRMAFKTTLVLAKGSMAPLRYSYKYTSGRSDGYEVTVKNGHITRLLTRGGRSSESTVSFQPETMIIDFNVYHHFDYLIPKYDLKKGGRQSFRNFLPLIGADVPIVIVRAEDSIVERGGQTIPVQNYKVEITRVWNGIISCDKDGRLVRLMAPDQELEVVRKDLMPELANPPKEEKKQPVEAIGDLKMLCIFLKSSIVN